MKELKELQEAFYAAIFNPNPETIGIAAEFVTDTSTMAKEDRLSIYRDSILGGITSGLSHIFPVCVKLVGETYFTHMVSGYLRQYTSDTPDLGGYGGHLASYISRFSPAKDLVYLADMAQLEWLWHQAFNAENEADQNIRTLSELEYVNESNHGSIHLQVVSSASLLTSPYPIHRIWQVNQDHYQGEQAVSLDEGSVQLLIWRQADFSMHIDVLSDDEYRFLSALLARNSLAEASEISFSQPLENIFQRCIQMGLISGFTLGQGS